jgi:DNA-binding MurR/RpiR family transcriptional regulator
MTNRPFTEIRHKYNTLSASQKVIANQILNNKKDAAMATISELAQKCDVSETTVMRFIKKLGYTSFQVFRIDLAHEFTEISYNQSSSDKLKIEDGYQDISADDDVATINQKVIQSASIAINDLKSLSDPTAIEATVSSFTQANKILFYGSGGSDVIALDAYHKFLRLGLNVTTHSNSHLMMIQASHLSEKDVAVLISHTGESREVLEIAENAKKQGTKIIGITSYINSTLAKLADITLFSSTNQLKYYTDAMVSRILQLVILDMIFVSVSLRLGDMGKESIYRSRKAIAVAKKPIPNN